MTVDQLLTECYIFNATEKKLSQCKPFSCGDADIDEFFSKDFIVNQHKLLGKAYFFCLKNQPDVIVTAFSLSNDSIRLTNRIADEYKELFLDDTDLRDKNLKRFPAALIGRLGTDKDYCGRGYGSAIRYLIKDERLEAKYMGIGMGHLPLNTRLMYFDLLNLNVNEDI